MIHIQIQRPHRATIVVTLPDDSALRSRLEDFARRCLANPPPDGCNHTVFELITPTLRNQLAIDEGSADSDTKELLALICGIRTTSR